MKIRKAVLLAVLCFALGFFGGKYFPNENRRAVVSIVKKDMKGAGWQSADFKKYKFYTCPALNFEWLLYRAERHPINLQDVKTIREHSDPKHLWACWIYPKENSPQGTAEIGGEKGVYIIDIHRNEIVVKKLSSGVGYRR